MRRELWCARDSSREIKKKEKKRKKKEKKEKKKKKKKEFAKRNEYEFSSFRFEESNGTF